MRGYAVLVDNADSIKLVKLRLEIKICAVSSVGRARH